MFGKTIPIMALLTSARPLVGMFPVLNKSKSFDIDDNSTSTEYKDNPPHTKEPPPLARSSPFTYSKLFKEFPRANQIDTPKLNNTLLSFSKPPIAAGNSSKVQDLYKQERKILGAISGRYDNRVVVLRSSNKNGVGTL